MCGIFGIWVDGRETIDENLLKAMSVTLRHRGPDHTSVFVGKGVGIGACRMRMINAIRETSHNEDSTVWAVLDGEVYNRNELRTKLEQRGHSLDTDCSEGLIPHLYEEYGHKCPQLLNGIFSFAVWDENTTRLLLARDRVGVKPLHYALDQQRGTLLFASEIKAILQDTDICPKVDPVAFHDYLAYAFVPEPRTMFAGIRKLKAGHVAVLDRGTCSTTQYWDWDFMQASQVLDYSGRLYSLLRRAVEKRLAADTDIGFFLSGGIDSSAVLALATELVERDRLKAFSVGCEEDTYNEVGDANLVAEHLGVEHQEVLVRPEIIDHLDKIIYHTDEPLADWSLLPTFLVCRLAKKHVNVVLTGDAADDLYAGHERMMADRLDTYYHRIPGPLRDLAYEIFRKVPDSSQQRGFGNVVKRFLDGSRLPKDMEDYRWWTYLSPGEEHRILQEAMRGEIGARDPFALVRQLLQASNAPDLLGKQLYVSLKLLSQGIREKMERMSMANSLATRMPFLDNDVLDFAATIPSNLKIRGRTSKWILKRSMSNVLPRRTLTKPKRGFTIPVKIWMRNEWRGRLEETLSAESLRRSGCIDHEYVRLLISDHLAGKKDNSHRLWPLMVFVIWHSMYIRHEKV